MLKAGNVFKLLVPALALILATMLGGIGQAQPTFIPASGCQEAAVLTIEQAINPGVGGFTQDRVLVPARSTTEVLGGWVLLDYFKDDPTVIGTSFNCDLVPDGWPLFVTQLSARPVSGDPVKAGLKTITFWQDRNFDGFWNPGVDTQLSQPMDASCLSSATGCVLSFGNAPIFNNDIIGGFGLGARLAPGPLSAADFDPSPPNNAVSTNAAGVLVVGEFENPTAGAVLQIELLAQASDIPTNPTSPVSSNFAPGYERQAANVRLVVQGLPPAGGGVLSPAISNGSASPETGVRGLDILGIRTRDDRDVFTDRDARAGDREYFVGLVNICEGAEPVTSQLTVLPPIAAATPTIAGFPGVATCVGLAGTDGWPTNVTGVRVGLSGPGAQWVQNVHVYADLGFDLATGFANTGIGGPGAGGVLFEPGELILSDIPDPVTGGYVAQIGSIQQVLTTSGGTPLLIFDGFLGFDGAAGTPDDFSPQLFYVTIDVDSFAQESDVVVELAIDIADVPGTISSRLLRSAVQTFNVHIKGLTPSIPTTGVAQFDANGNNVIDDSEFFNAIDQWVAGTVSDQLFFDVLDAWVSQSPVSGASAPGLSSVLSQSRQGLTLAVSGQDVSAVGLEVYDLNGRTVFAKESQGNRLSWNYLSASGQPVANGVYLYVVTVVGANGEIVRSKVDKLVVLR